MKLWKKTSLVFLLCFAIGYVLLCIGMWHYSLNTTAEYYLTSNQKYIAKHEASIRTTIFNQLFTDAKICTNVPSQEKKPCEQEITYRLAVSIIEEDFLDKDGYGWPTDIFFVKETPTSLVRLGWEGKYVDITGTAEKNVTSVPLFIRLLTNHCHPFNKDSMTTNNCEIYSKIYLGNNETGYIVRLMGIDEEQEPFFAVIFPLFIFMNLPYALSHNDPYASYMIIPFYIFLSILVGATCIAYLYYVRHMKKSHD